MSPAMLAPSNGQPSPHYPFNSFASFSSSQYKKPMNPSSGFDLSVDPSSGFSNSIKNKSRTRPRFLKLRKQLNSKTLKRDSDSNNPVEGFNPFRSVMTESSDHDSSGSGIPKSGGNEPFVFRASMNRKWDSGAVMEEMRNLKIGSGNEFVDSYKKAPSFDQNVASKLHDEMRKLNIKDLKSGGLGKNGSGSTVSEGRIGSSAAELLEDLKNKLNLQVDGKNNETGNLRNALPEKIKNLSINEEIDEHKHNQKGSFEFTGNKSSRHLSEERGRTLANEIEEKLKLASEKGCSSVRPDSSSSSEHYGKGSKNEILGDGKFHNIGKAVRVESRANDTSCSLKFTDQLKDDTKAAAAPAPISSISSNGMHFQEGNHPFGATVYDMAEKKNYVSEKQNDRSTPFVPFQTQTVKPNILSGFNQKLEFGAKREAGTSNMVKKRKGKLKQPTPIQLFVGQDFGSVASGSNENAEPLEPYSPMDVSPYQETLADTHPITETSLPPDVAYRPDNNCLFNDSKLADSNDLVDDDLVAATVKMDINEAEVKCEETKEEDSQHVHNKDAATNEVPGEESVSGAETESFKSAAEEIDLSDTAISSSEHEASSSVKFESQHSDVNVQSGSPSDPENRRGLDFSFAASTDRHAQLPAQKRLSRKKNSAKAMQDSYNSSAANLRIPYTSSSFLLSPLATSPSLLSPRKTHNEVSSSPSNVQDLHLDQRGHEMKHEVDLNSSVTAAAQEACEKWRLRGNQAYTSGDFSKAEDCYTEGINCVSKYENSRNCVRALMLCYSNRAATRMSLGRMRDAILDCMSATAIDTNFLKVQIRAANCYLALGEVENASIHFKKCLNSGSTICVDRKIAVEASDGIHKTQKVSECMSRSAELLRRGTCDDAKSALEAIDEALQISLHAEKLLEMKAEALLKLHKYEEVIQLCEQTFDAAEKNYPLLDASRQISDVDSSASLRDYKFRVWRCRFMFNSCFYQGKLDEAVLLLQKQEEVQSVTRDGSNSIESAIPLAATVRQLLHHKAAGNEAFQTGKLAEAIEHYTAAISCSVESRPFAAICFCNRAAAYKSLGQITDAIADCSVAIAFDSNYLKAISRRSTLYEMIRDYEQAATDIQRLIKKLEERISQSGASDRSMNLVNDIRQARLRLSELEEASKKELPLDMYIILGVENKSVSGLEIKKAYRKAALRHHPDKAVQFLARNDNGDDSLWKAIGEEAHKDADKLFKMIGEAYAVLSEPAKRGQYDYEEALRDFQKKQSCSTSRMPPADAQNYPFDRTGARRQWRDVWKSYGNAASRAPESTNCSYRYS